MILPEGASSSASSSLATGFPKSKINLSILQQKQYVRPLVMGILNVTPDSFSDGGDFFDPQRAIDRAVEMIEEGADIIDVGGESTRPGSRTVDDHEQIRRTIPVIEGIRRRSHTGEKKFSISIDTRSAAVASEAISTGVEIINDVSALRDDPKMAGVVVDARAIVILMHRRGMSGDMQANGGPIYENVVKEIRDFLIERRDFAEMQGIARSRIWLDPGIGFGKRVEDNLRIIREVAELGKLGSPVVIGASRKRFIGAVLGIDDPKNRDAGSIACAVFAAIQGAAVLRVHDVKGTVEALRMLEAISSAEESGR